MEILALLPTSNVISLVPVSTVIVRFFASTDFTVPSIAVISFCVSFPAVSFAQRLGEARDDVAWAACLVGRRTEMFGGRRSGELNSLAGEAAKRGRPQ